jgi:hypothetical protein
MIVNDVVSGCTFCHDEASHGDIIDGYWKHRVSARLRRRRTGYLLMSIDNTD